MLRNSKKDEEFDEESGDESPLIVPGSRSRENKTKKNSSSSFPPLTWVVMLAFVAGIGVGKSCRGVVVIVIAKNVSLCYGVPVYVESTIVTQPSWGLIAQNRKMLPLLSFLRFYFVAIALPRSIDIHLLDDSIYKYTSKET